MPKKIPVVFSCDNDYAPLCSVAISSIIDNATAENLYDIYIFHTRLNKENIDKLEMMSKGNICIKCVNVEQYLDFDILYETSKYPIEMYYRYYAPQILEYEKIIYLDCDTIVIEDIAKLYNEDLENKPIAMIRDFTYYTNEIYTDYNSGVLVFNTKEFEEQKIRQKWLDVLKVNTQYRFPDQTAINIVCKENMKELKPMYNYQTSLACYTKFIRKIHKKKYRDLFTQKPIVIHFSYVTKPYKNIYSEYNKCFWQYAKKTPYYNQLVDEYVSDPYKVLKESPIDEMCIDMAREGKAGLKKIFYIFFNQIKYWFLFKIHDNKNAK